jgi:hypothetical protein
MRNSDWRRMIVNVKRPGGGGLRHGFWIAHLFPVEGDSAIAELWHGDDVWADIRLEGVALDAFGEDRVATAAAVLRIYPRPASGASQYWEWGLDQALEQLEAGRKWLIENERGRMPVDEGLGLSAAGSALSKASADVAEQFAASVPPASHPDPPRLGTGDLAVVMLALGRHRSA